LFPSMSTAGNFFGTAVSTYHVLLYLDFKDGAQNER